MCSSFQHCRNSDVVWRLHTYLCRLIGIMTAIGTWAVGVETAILGHWLGYYLLAVALIITFLETLFIIELCYSSCLRDRNQHACLRVCLKFQCIDCWRRGLLYLVFSVACFVQPHKLWLPCISGALLIICGMLYFQKTIRGRDELQDEEDRGKKQTYDRYTDEIEEDLENSDLGRVSGKPIFAMSESIADQEEIMEL